MILYNVRELVRKPATTTAITLMRMSDETKVQTTYDEHAPDELVPAISKKIDDRPRSRNTEHVATSLDDKEVENDHENSVSASDAEDLGVEAVL
jgi:hypothetical protein